MVDKGKRGLDGEEEQERGQTDGRGWKDWKEKTPLLKVQYSRQAFNERLPFWFSMNSNDTSVGI